jgi:hypothetical protein
MAFLGGPAVWAGSSRVTVPVPRLGGGAGAGSEEGVVEGDGK